MAKLASSQPPAFRVEATSDDHHGPLVVPVVFYELKHEPPVEVLGDAAVLLPQNPTTPIAILPVMFRCSP